MKDFTSQNTAIAEDETKLARTVAALLVEAAMADGDIDELNMRISAYACDTADLSADDASHAR